MEQDTVSHWNGRSANKENLRMFEAPNIWRRYADFIDKTDNSIVTRGCMQKLESDLINSLNATNVLLLTGAGSSFSASNKTESKIKQKTAPGLIDLWNAVKSKFGDAKFESVINTIPNGNTINDNNIETLLTQCKLYVALYQNSTDKARDIAEFIDDAEAAILERVDFVDEATELDTPIYLAREG